MSLPAPYSSTLPAARAPLVRDDVGLDAIAPAAWDELASGHPFLSHAFFSALHDTGCASPQTGWRPRFVTAWQGRTLVGAMPLYVKAHSYGEYVFDWSWADAYRRYGRRYYPKLVCAVPFTPVPGPRLLTHDPSIRRSLLEHAQKLVATGEYSSLHVLFPEGPDLATGEQAGMIVRHGMQFHWDNVAYRDFDDYLASFSHDKRKKVRQERRKLEASGVHFVRKTGAEITDADWSFFFSCYRRTYRLHHSTPYLSLALFQRIGETLCDHMLLAVGLRDGRPICAALDVYTPQTLWGRYWGTLEYVSGLHFEACYYQAIEFCIERGISRFEGGAQGLHKLARGLLPVTTHSLHDIGDRRFASAIAEYCARERVDVAHSVDELEQASPFRDHADL
jgi:predicted N-acyltransferase